MAQDRSKFRGHGRFGSRGLPRARKSDGHGSSNVDHNPDAERRYYGKRIQDALDPVKAPGKVRTLADMSPEERAAIEKRYAKEDE